MGELAPLRWTGVGYDGDADAATAGSRAARLAVAGRDPALLLVFCTVSYDLERLLDGVRAHAGAGTVIAGCTSDGQVIDGHPERAPGGVVVAALGGPGLEVRAEVGRDVSGRRREAGSEAAASATELTMQHRICLLLCDGLVGEQHEVVRGAYSVLGAAVRLAGGCAGDDETYSATYQFIGDRQGVEVLTDAVVGVGLGSDAGIGVGISHGWCKTGEPMIVTSSSGGRLFQLDGGPALDVYLDRIGADRGLLEDLKLFRSTVFTSPLGMSRRSGEDIRVVHDGDPHDGSLLCLADIPQGALAWMMGSTPDSLVAAGAASCAQAIEELQGAPPIGLLVFDCGARRTMLGHAGLRREMAAMTAVAPGVPLGGFYTFGEVARTRGARGMHHLTVVTLALA